MTPKHEPDAQIEVKIGIKRPRSELGSEDVKEPATKMLNKGNPEESKIYA